MEIIRVLSVIVPAYNEEAMIATTERSLSQILGNAGIPYEIIFIDDGSTDDTWNAIFTLSEDGADNVKAIRFSRNFGKEAAISAGLESAQGDCCVVIDCDLQHPPEKIIDMYRLWEDGYQVVEGVKADRGEEGKLHRALAKSFYGLISLSTDTDMSRSSDFKLLDRKAIDAINSMHESGSFFRASSYWVGFKTCEVPYEVQSRMQGSSKWNGWSLTKYAIRNIASFSAAPMQLITVLGVVAFAVAIVFSIITLVQWTMGTAIGGFTTVILLLLFMSSLVMISLGLIGYYIARIYEEVQGRPRYVISDSID